MSDPVLYEQDGAVVTLTLNRPDELNAFSEPSMIDAFLEAVDRIRRDGTVRAVVLTGAGRAFSAGGNVKHMREKTDMFAGTPAEIREAYRHGILRVPPVFYNLDIPTIAAVNGPAFGAALDLVCMCDIRLAAPEAHFGAPFVNIGIAPGDGAAWFLPRIIGQGAAAEMLLTGEPIDAETAKSVGLVSRIIPKTDLLAEAQAVAQTIAGKAPVAVKLTKKLMRDGQHTRLEPHLEMCAAYQAIAHHTDDHMEALDAFFEKRPGNYKGK
ncbi:crotonase/enoyl-CoA hydratase family protein [Aestuariispira ectoiniformans]|uniref:crotonase/enoyl-CoA hydratase family protein n=1 Tax=Aestuariispira ectoiniformans TaxID=2775080 RepID=UPI00223C50B8|nr:crotonase/enoyl-CoA hydratase family protein [Aestuariispira ectoiniformans]